MTATPRVYGESVKSKALDNGVELASMDNELLYGKEFYKLGFGESVEKGLLTDYKVQILIISEDYIRKEFQNKLAEDSEIDIEDLGKLVGCWNGLSKRHQDGLSFESLSDSIPMKRAVIFTSTIANSLKVVKRFTELQHDSNYKDLVRIEIDHVDGKMRSMERSDKLIDLKTGHRYIDENTFGCKILSNARCLSEGVDVPSLDAVIFLSPRNSVVDIVQSVGRVMRISEGKDFGYIILPIVVPTNMLPEEALNDNTKFKAVWSVLQALRAHDDRFDATINKLDLIKSNPDNIDVLGIGFNSDEDEDGEKVTYHDDALKALETVHLEDWKDAVYTRMVKKCGDRDYLKKWTSDIIITVDRIKDTLRDVLDNHSDVNDEFILFVESLQNNINTSINKEDVIDMVAQHLITKPIFDALFQNYSFSDSNPISKSLNRLVDKLDKHQFSDELKKLESLYKGIKNRVSKIDDLEAKQRVITELYENFFKFAFPKDVDRLGVVYTPVEVVDFIVRSVNDVLKDKFDKTLADNGVEIIDPFTGTGTFIVRLLQSGLIPKDKLEYKYSNEIFANEIMLLAYYIATVNIEESFHHLKEDGGYKTFDGIVLTDTFALNENESPIHNQLFPENNERIKRQKNSNIKVIIGNPPYRAKQENENDDNQSFKYERLDESIKNSYVKNSNSANMNALYDSYIRAFRWSTTRIKDEGIVGFITNGNYIDNNSMAGFRKSIEDEFSYIYCFNLKGGIRGKSGDNAKREGDNVFNIMTGVAIIILAKVKGYEGKAEIRYHEIDDYLKRKDKLNVISNLDFKNIDWKMIEPNETYDWINQRGEVFNSFIPLGDNRDKSINTVFDIYSRGVATSKDTWCYNFSKDSLAENMSRMIDFYNSEVNRYKQLDEKIDIDKFITIDPEKISWSVTIKDDIKRSKEYRFSDDNVRESMYRPFSKEYMYFDKRINERTYQMPKIFPTVNHENIVIMINGIGSSVNTSVFISYVTPDLNILAPTQCFPLYHYSSEGTPVEVPDEHGYYKHSAISDYIYDECSSRYGELIHEDIFYYVYGILHSTDYRKDFANDLKKVLARLPLVKSKDDFWTFSNAGRDLARIHLNYETVAPYNTTDDIKENANYKVDKMKFLTKGKDKDKSVIIYNNHITIKDIPIHAYDYIINGRSAIEWIMDRYTVKIDKDSKIVNDANKYCESINDDKYIFNLLKRVITVSIKTNEIVNSLPQLSY